MDSNDRLSAIALGALGTVAVLGTASVIVLAFYGKEPTASFAAVVAAAVTQLGNYLGGRLTERNGPRQ